MKPLQTKTNNIPRRWNHRFLLAGFVFIVGLGVLSYYGYCFGLWGTGNLLFQILFQRRCSCSGISEEWRYPEEADVIVSACHLYDVILSPSGRLLHVQQYINGLKSMYILNLETGEQTPIVLPEGSNYFLTDSLMLHSSPGDDRYVLELTTGIMYPIQSATRLTSGVYSMGYVESNLLLEALLRVDQIFLIDDVFQPVIALSSDFRTHPENSFTFDTLDFPPGDFDRVRQFLQENNLTYEYVPSRLTHEVVSPDGRFIARDDGIYEIKTNQLIVIAPGSGLKGWAHDGRGAIYRSYRCRYDLSVPGLDMTCLYWETQPVLLVKVPEKYLFLTP